MGRTSALLGLILAAASGCFGPLSQVSATPVVARPGKLLWRDADTVPLPRRFLVEGHGAVISGDQYGYADPTANVAALSSTARDGVAPTSKELRKEEKRAKAKEKRKAQKKRMKEWNERRNARQDAKEEARKTAQREKKLRQMEKLQERREKQQERKMNQQQKAKEKRQMQKTKAGNREKCTYKAKLELVVKGDVDAIIREVTERMASASDGVDDIKVTGKYLEDEDNTKMSSRSTSCTTQEQQSLWKLDFLALTADEESYQELVSYADKVNWEQSVLNAGACTAKLKNLAYRVKCKGMAKGRTYDAETGEVKPKSRKRKRAGDDGEPAQPGLNEEEEES